MIDRLFQIVYLLADHPQMTAKELAGRFEVSERTIYRDIDKLCAAGIPIYTTPGKNGGISILSDYVLDKTVLTTDEKSKILQSLNALNELDHNKGNGSTAKLRDFLGNDFQDWLEIDFSGWRNGKAEAALFEQIKNAILSHHYMDILYSGNQNSLVKRTIKPLKLCFKDQAWYLYAYCCLREDYRFFKLRRISEITTLDTFFEPEPVGRVLPDKSDTYKNNSSIKVVVEIDPQIAFRAFEELMDVTISDNGNLRCTIEVNDNDLNWFISYVLSYGSHMRVIEPETLKFEIQQEVYKMLRI